MKYNTRLLVLVASLPLACSCATLPKKLDTTYSINQSVQKAGMSAFQSICRRLATNCFNDGDTDCPQLKACQAQRDAFVEISSGVDGLIALAKSELAAGRVEQAKEYIARAKEHLSKIQDVLERLLGVDND